MANHSNTGSVTHLHATGVPVAAGIDLVSAPGAGYRLQVFALWIALSNTAADANTLANIAGYSAGTSKRMLECEIVPSAANVAHAQLAIPYGLLLDENTAIRSVAGADAGTRRVGVIYRVVKGTGTS